MTARTAAALVLAALCAPGCLVVSTSPAYDDETIAWEPRLVGTWTDADGAASVTIEASEWRSYRIALAHPVERGTFTGYVTRIGGAAYLDVTPARGEDPGALLVPVHAVLRLVVDDERLELTPLSYDWFYDRVRAKRPTGTLRVVRDAKENALIVSPTAALRAWLQQQSAGGVAFGAPLAFTRKR